MAGLAFACRAAVLVLATACAAARAAEGGAAAPGRRQAGLSFRLGDPGRGQGAQIDRTVRGAEVCRPAAQGGGPVGQALHTGDEFIYEITLLNRDGRLARIQMEAGTGKMIVRAPREPQGPHERRAPVKN